MLVCSFRGVNYLSVGAECAIEGVDDIGEVEEMQEGVLEERGVVRKVVEGEIDGVLCTEEYVGCMACKAKVQSEDGVLAECTKCGMIMKVTKCTKFMTARVSVGGRDGKVHTLTMFDSVVSKIIDGVGGGDVKRKLLAAPACRFLVDKGCVVYSVNKL